MVSFIERVLNMLVIKTKPIRTPSFQGLFEKVFFWKEHDDSLIKKLTNFCMFGPNYVEPEYKNFMTMDEFLDYNSPNTRTKAQRVLDWISMKSNCISYVKIEGHDLWNLDSTLADIIHPSLIKLKAVNQGYHLVDDEDVPENLKTNSVNSEDNFSLEKWHYILDEMIYSFNTKIVEDLLDNDEDVPRIKNGYRLFGKYYQSLWT